MPKKFADQLGEDTITRFVRSAPMRLDEGDLLSADHPLAAIYLYGYAAEMAIKAAYFKNLGFTALDVIDRDARNRAMAVAQLNQFLGRDPHDILGWARFLIWDRANLHTPEYPSDLSRQIVSNAAAVYDHWRPEMRYRNSLPQAKIVAIVRNAAGWLVENYPKM